VRPVHIGAFVIPLNEIEKIFSSNSGWMSYKKDIHGIGSVEITAKRYSAEKSYILQKKEESMRGLEKQIETIENYNKDTNLPVCAKMSANVRGIGGISLLHAAIELVDTDKIISKLLHLNANLFAESETLGTPMELANKFYERSQLKLEEAKREGKASEVIEAHRKRHLQAWRIRDLLQNKSKDQLREAETISGDAKMDTRQVSFA
jgi:hypothetical protein